jgi:hypothetical protein
MLQGIPVCLMGPALPLFSNLRKLTANWRGDGLERPHLNCLKDVPLLEHLSVTYSGTVDLGPNFPEGECLIKVDPVWSPRVRADTSLVSAFKHSKDQVPVHMYRRSGLD